MPVASRRSRARSRPTTGAVLAALAVLSVIAVGLGTFLPARGTPQVSDVAGAVGAAGPPSTLAQTTAVQSTLAQPSGGRTLRPVTLLYQSSPDRPMLPLDSAVVHGLIGVELAGDTRGARSVRFVLHAPNGATSELTGRTAPFRAALPLGTAVPGNWQLDAVADGVPSSSRTTTARFTVTPL